MKILSTKIWPWNWKIFRKKENDLLYDESKAIEQIMQTALKESKKNRIKKKTEISADFFEDWLEYFVFFTGGISSYFVCLFNNPKNTENQISFYVLSGFFLWMASVIATVICCFSNWISVLALVLFSMINYTIAYFWLAPRKTINSDGTISRENSIQSLLKEKIAKAKERMIGENSPAQIELKIVNKQISELIGEQAKWREYARQGSEIAPEMVESVTIGIIELTNLKQEIESRIEKCEKMLACANARVEAQTPLFNEFKMIQETREKLPKTKELADRLAEIDKKLKQAIREELGTVIRAMQTIEFYTTRKLLFSSNEIRENAELTAQSNIEFHTAFEEISGELEIKKEEMILQ